MSQHLAPSPLWRHVIDRGLKSMSMGVCYRTNVKCCSTCGTFPLTLTQIPFPFSVMSPRSRGDCSSCPRLQFAPGTAVRSTRRYPGVLSLSKVCAWVPARNVSPFEPRVAVACNKQLREKIRSSIVIQQSPKLLNLTMAFASNEQLRKSLCFLTPVQQ